MRKWTFRRRGPRRLRAIKRQKRTLLHRHRIVSKPKKRLVLHFGRRRGAPIAQTFRGLRYRAAWRKINDYQVEETLRALLRDEPKRPLFIRYFLHVRRKRRRGRFARRRFARRRFFRFYFGRRWRKKRRALVRKLTSTPTPPSSKFKNLFISAFLRDLALESKKIKSRLRLRRRRSAALQKICGSRFFRQSSGGFLFTFGDLNLCNGPSVMWSLKLKMWSSRAQLLLRRIIKLRSKWRFFTKSSRLKRLLFLQYSLQRAVALLSSRALTVSQDCVPLGRPSLKGIGQKSPVRFSILVRRKLVFFKKKKNRSHVHLKELKKSRKSRLRRKRIIRGPGRRRRPFKRYRKNRLRAIRRRMFRFNRSRRKVDSYIAIGLKMKKNKIEPGRFTTIRLGRKNDRRWISVMLRSTRNNVFASVFDPDSGNLLLWASKGQLDSLVQTQRVTFAVVCDVISVVLRLSHGLHLSKPIVIRRLTLITRYRILRGLLRALGEGGFSVYEIARAPRHPHNGCRLPKVRRI